MTGAGGAYTVQAPLNDGGWHHLVTTYGGGYKKVYFDGVILDSAVQTGAVSSTTATLSIGDTGASANNLLIDDVRRYQIALSADEVSALYNDGLGDIGTPKFAITSPSSILGTCLLYTSPSPRD